MKKIALAFIVALSVACFGVFGKEFSELKYMMNLHKNAWVSGGVCRHAAAAVWRRARQIGTPCKILLFSVEEPSNFFFHVVPVVFIEDRWYAIETGGGKVVAREWDGNLDANWFERIVGGRNLKAYIGEEPNSFIERSIIQLNEILKTK